MRSRAACRVLTGGQRAAQVRYLVVPEEDYRQKCARALLSPAEAAAYQEVCAGLVEPYKNVVRFDGARAQPLCSRRGCSRMLCLARLRCSDSNAMRPTHML